MIDGPTRSPWQQLGIAPTTDREAIRRAYAVLVKAIDPARDPQMFRRLRSAYEAALHGETAAPTSQERPDLELQPDAARPIWQNLRAGDVAAAFRLLEVADAAAELPLSAVRELEEAMIAQSPSLPPATLSLLARHFGWDEAAHPLRRLRPALFRPLDRRLDAERWFGELLARAEARPWSLPDGRFAARLLLRGPPRWHEGLGPTGWRLALLTPRRALAEALKQYSLHEEALRDRFDARRIQWCRRQIRFGRVFAGYVVVFGSIAPIAVIVQDGNVMAGLAAWTIQMSIALFVWIVYRISLRFRRAG